MELNLNKKNILEFSLLVEGTNTPISEARLTFCNLDPIISFKGKSENGKLTFEVSNLKKYLTEGEYPIKLEVFVENSYFVTYEGDAKITTPLNISTNLTEAKTKEKIVTSPIIKRVEDEDEKDKKKTPLPKDMNEPISSVCIKEEKKTQLGKFLLGKTNEIL